MIRPVSRCTFGRAFHQTKNRVPFSTTFVNRRSSSIYYHIFRNIAPRERKGQGYSFSQRRLSNSFDSASYSLGNRSKVYIPDRIVSIVQHPDLIHRIPLEDVRNFCIIAHIDHGKSSISSRLLEFTGNLGADSQKDALQAAKGNHDFSSEHHSDDKSTNKSLLNKHSTTTTTTSKAFSAEKEQIELLDTLSVERERGITVKASTATMLYPHPSAVGPEGVLLVNCIDCPGHSDFSSEVARSLSFVQGAVLLLDASQGIQVRYCSCDGNTKVSETFFNSVTDHKCSSLFF
jgi:translation elongation factor EF-1alpha